MSDEEWTVCIECSVNVRTSQTQDGLCYWCTPEGKAEAARFEERLFDALVKAGADIVPLQSHEQVRK